MSETVLELVPRNREVLERDLQLIRASFPGITTINVPDLLQFELRSWDACAIVQQYVPRSIPHLRAIDFDLKADWPCLETIRTAGCPALLAISGDPPQDMLHRTFRTPVTDFISRLKRDLPGVKIFAGLDPYRSGIKEELDYVRAKLQAGADGLFTQPFFDLRFMEIWADLLEGIEVYWGIAPVLTEKSQAYWENKNNAYFPAGFAPTLEWNREFARQALRFAAERNASSYIMPIRADIRKYLEGIL
ncbi:MAG TPA: methylenetetrahydrofolate reductase [Geothermobacteraceae bacterium]|nr:methylenetetrahydrofolate reductase [Geothermobacteraceae bacterium]